MPNLRVGEIKAKKRPQLSLSGCVCVSVCADKMEGRMLGWACFIVSIKIEYWDGVVYNSQLTYIRN